MRIGKTLVGALAVVLGIASLAVAERRVIVTGHHHPGQNYIVSDKPAHRPYALTGYTVTGNEPERERRARPHVSAIMVGNRIVVPPQSR